MNGKLLVLIAWALTCCWVVLAQGDADWWNSRWRFRTSVVRPGPYPDGAARPVEVALDFPLLLQRAGVAGEFDPGSVRVVQPGAGAAAAQIPCIQRTEPDPRTGQPRSYLAWMAEPGPDRLGRFDIYFETTDRDISAPAYDADRLLPENLLGNPGFEDGLTGWTIEPAGVATVGAFEHTADRQSLRVGAALGRGGCCSTALCRHHATPPAWPSPAPGRASWAGPRRCGPECCWSSTLRGSEPSAG